MDPAFAGMTGVYNIAVNRSRADVV